MLSRGPFRLDDYSICYGDKIVKGNDTILLFTESMI